MVIYKNTKTYIIIIQKNKKNNNNTDKVLTLHTCIKEKKDLTYLTYPSR